MLRRVALRRKSPLRPKPKRDPVTPEMRRAVLQRDLVLMGGCIAARYDPEHECRDAWGQPHQPDDLDRLTLDHVNEGYGRMGKRAPSDAGHLISACYAAHLGGWTTSRANRDLIRWILGGAS